MTSHQWSPNHRLGSEPYPYAKPHVPEETLRTETVQVERKTFVLTLKENVRGRFLRITEDVRGRKDTIIIPAPGLEDFKRVLESMLGTSEALPPKPISTFE